MNAAWWLLAGGVALLVFGLARVIASRIDERVDQVLKERMK